MEQVAEQAQKGGEKLAQQAQKGGAKLAEVIGLTGVALSDAPPADAAGLGMTAPGSSRSRTVDALPDSCCSSMSYKNRMVGFSLGLVGAGIFIALSMLFLLLVKMGPFVIYYTLATISSIAAVFFLVGPKKQAKNMVDPKRAIPSVIMIISIIFTLIFGLKKIVILALPFAVIQFASFWYYTLTYVPFGTKGLKKLFAVAKSSGPG